MKTIKSLLNEMNKTVTIYHGGEKFITKLDPKYMLTKSSNAQEGIGIYFGTLEVARSYGGSISSVTVAQNKFVPSREDISVIGTNNIYKILKYLNSINKEAMFYLISDWVEVQNPEDVTDKNIKTLADYIKTDEVRNFQITMSEQFGVENFVKAWNKFLPNIIGTYNKDNGFYAIINTKIKVQKFQEEK